MRRVQTEVLVVGGGATGLGVLRDLAMRGFECVLVEQRDLTHGTTGRYHGLLHSGGRYVVKDPHAAVECIEENRVLRKIMPHCLEDTGGFFVVTPWDDPDYVPKFIAGCHAAGIPVGEIPVPEALAREPYLNRQISHCFEVPDAAADSFLAAESTAASARNYGADVLTYHEVTSLEAADGRVVGARCHDLANGEDVLISADLVVNASGAWAGRIAATAGVSFEVQAGKGTMLALNHRMLNTVVNRCKLPDDGDIIVPIRTVAVVGTTDEGVPDPGRYAVEPWEVKLMLEEGEKLVPGISSMRVLRAWAGVRPLYQESGADATRDVTRAYALLDHATRDGIEGLVTITGGKWTTFRQMAEVTVDVVCRQLDVKRECRTHLEEVPDHRRRHRYQNLGERLARIEERQEYGDLVCECELVTRADIARSLAGDAKTIDDIRRDVRLGMGPCQGGWCIPRVAGILHETRSPPAAAVNAALRDFLLERWKGVGPIAWGSQLRQAALDDLIFSSLLAVDTLPGPAASPLGPILYKPPTDDTRIEHGLPATQRWATTVAVPGRDVVVVGGGLAGLTAAWSAARTGADVALLTKGWGSLAWHTGCIDLAAGHGDTPAARIKALRQDPNHPYSAIGIDDLEEAITALVDLCGGTYPMLGGLDTNLTLPTALGGRRQTALAPVTMMGGDLDRNDPMLLVGFDRFGDFHPLLAAANLGAHGVSAHGVNLTIAELSARRFVNGPVLARMFDDVDFAIRIAETVKGHLGNAARVGFPAVLGDEHAPRTVAAMTATLEVDVFEIPCLPPSVPGLRLQRLLRKELKRIGVKIHDNAEVTAIRFGDGWETAVSAAARTMKITSPAVIVATGGVLGGGIVGNADGSLVDVAAGLTVEGPDDRSEWLRPDLAGQPVFAAGIRTTALEVEGRPGMFVAGSQLAGADPVAGGCLEGVGLGTGWAAGRAATT